MPEQQKSIKVRIALVVNEKGEWNAYGWHKYTAEEALSSAVEGMDASLTETQYFVEVDVPLPEPTSISGRLVPGSL